MVNIPSANTVPPNMAYKITQGEYQVNIGIWAIVRLQSIYGIFLKYNVTYSGIEHLEILMSGVMRFMQFDKVFMEKK